MKQKNNILYRWYLLPLCALFIFGLTLLANRFPEYTERWYAQKLYPVLARIISALTSVLPFSLDDIFYVLLIAGFIVLLALVAIRMVSLKRAGIVLLNSVSAIYILFYVLWGFNYYREGLNQRLGIAERESSQTEFILQLGNLIESANRTFCSFEKMDKVEIDSLIENSYKLLAPAIKVYYPGGIRNDKTITFNRFFAMAGISGYYGPFFSEVHVNSEILNLEYPFVLAHEKAHQFGVTSEAEANFYAWLVCSKSGSEQIMYSANLHVLRYFMFQAYQLEAYPEIISKLDKNVKVDFRRIQENWMKLRNEKVDKVASKVNDTYLKTNRVTKGIEDYKGVVKYIMDYSQDSVFQNKIYSCL